MIVTGITIYALPICLFIRVVYTPICDDYSSLYAPTKYASPLTSALKDLKVIDSC